MQRYDILIILLALSAISLSGCGGKDKADFLEALKQGNWEEAQVLLDRHPDFVYIHLKSGDGATLLHSAVYYDSKEMLEFLLKNGANVNAVSRKDKDTPLHFAARYGKYGMASVLLEHGADVNARDYLLYTPLHNASKYSTNEMVKLLLSHGAQIDAINNMEVTPLYCACVNRDEDAEAIGVVETLLINGADPNERYVDGSSIIKIAVGFQYFKKAQLLENYGAKLELETDEGIKVFTVKEAQGN